MVPAVSARFSSSRLVSYSGASSVCVRLAGGGERGGHVSLLCLGLVVVLFRAAIEAGGFAFGVEAWRNGKTGSDRRKGFRAVAAHQSPAPEEPERGLFRGSSRRRADQLSLGSVRLLTLRRFPLVFVMVLARYGPPAWASRQRPAAHRRNRSIFSRLVRLTGTT